MKTKQVVLIGAFWLGCLAFGYFGIQKLGAVTTIASGVTMGCLGAVALPAKSTKAEEDV